MRDPLNAGRHSPAEGPMGPARPGLGLTRRRFLGGGAAVAAGVLMGADRLPAGQGLNPVAGGKPAGLVAFEDEQVGPAGRLMGSELDGRLFTDLSRVSEGRMITPNSEFFVRTAASRLLPGPAGWKVKLDGLVQKPLELGIDEIERAAKPMGVHLMECAGNVARTRFGLMSAADWMGAPVLDLLNRAKAKDSAGWVEIAGFDEYSAASGTSTPGASWVFPLDGLKEAFLATEMNGQRLRPDHGAPVRLVIPGWYGAACIKWVNRISFVEETAEASSQMREYAVRTLQAGRPQLAREYAPATVDPAAVPARVEKWIVAGKIRYRVAGLAWGALRPGAGLQIRFNPEEPFRPVEGFQPANTDSWTIWTHAWTPSAPGDYRIRMGFADSTIHARKLDLGLYDRTVHISEV